MYIVMSYIYNCLLLTLTLRSPHATSGNDPPAVKHAPPCASLLCAHP